MDLGTAIQNFIEQYGILSIFIIVLLEYSNLPIPSELVLPLVGIFISTGTIGMIEAIFTSILAGIVGSLLNYFLGYYFGNPLIKSLVKSNPKLKKSIDSSMWWISRYGELSVMISRVIPVARTFISIPAGVIKMNIYKFIGYSSLGITIWNSALIYLGYICGNNIELINNILEKYSIGAALIITCLFTTLLLIHFQKLRKSKNNLLKK